MGTPTCTHGLAQRNKYGTEQRDGLEVCLGSGESVAISGVTVGIYLFRSAETG
jgi:hypothetical protein